MQNFNFYVVAVTLWLIIPSFPYINIFDPKIPDDWYMENSGQQKRIDTYWAKLFEIRSETGYLNYSLLSKVIKSFLAMPNGNANVERSLSDNKNTLTSERTKMTKETLEGLRRMEEHAQSCGIVHNINTLSRGEF